MSESEKTYTFTREELLPILEDAMQAVWCKQASFRTQSAGNWKIISQCATSTILDMLESEARNATGETDAD